MCVCVDFTMKKSTVLKLPFPYNNNYNNSNRNKRAITFPSQVQGIGIYIYIYIYVSNQYNMYGFLSCSDSIVSRFFVKCLANFYANHIIQFVNNPKSDGIHFVKWSNEESKKCEKKKYQNFTFCCLK